MMRIMIASTMALSLLLFAEPVATADPEPGPAGPVANTIVTLPDLLALNPAITNPDLIYPGQVVNIPGREPHTVAAGETLTLIIGGTPAPAVAAPVPVAPSVPPVRPAVASSGVNWDAVARCESGGNWAINTGNGFEGGVQFLNSTWLSVKMPGDPPHAYQASREAQIAAAERLLARSGIGQWPVCGKRG